MKPGGSKLENRAGIGIGIGSNNCIQGRLAGRLAVWFNLHGIDYQTSIFNISRSIQALYHYVSQQPIMLPL